MPVRWLLIAITMTLTAGCSGPETPASKTQLANQGLLTAALSPDGTRLFTGSFQHGGALWNQTTHGRLFDWNHNAQGFSAYHAADFSEDGRFLAATDGIAVTIWDTTTGESVLFLQSPAQSMAIQNTDAVWQTVDGQAEQYWQRPARIIDLALSGQYILLGLENQVVLLIDSVEGQVIGALGHDEVITDIAMDDRAEIAVTGTRGGTLTVWSLQDGSIQHRLNFSSPISYTGVSPDGKRAVVATSKGPVELLTMSSQQLDRQTLFRGNPGVIAVNFPHQNSDELILGSSREQVWRLQASTGAVLNQWRVPKRGPWHKAAIVALHDEQGQVQAIASDGFAYQLN